MDCGIYRHVMGTTRKHSSRLRKSYGGDKSSGFRFIHSHMPECLKGSSIDLTACMVDILDSFNMATDSSDIGQPPDELSIKETKRKSSQLEYEVSSVDSTHTCLSRDSGVNDLDRNSIWRNSSSSSASAGSTISHQSALSLISDGPPNDAVASHINRHSSLVTGSKTHFIMDEVIQTEKNYVEDLRQICQGYLQQMRQSTLFSSEDLTLVFANLEDILSFHETFFAMLLPPDLTGPAYLAERFNEYAQEFEIYTEYCINFPVSVKHLAQLTRYHSEWFRARQAEVGHSLQLGTYLLKPIQRILKYHLLLQKLLDNCDCDAVGYQCVLLAYESMRNIAQKINEVQNQKERKIRLEELELLLVELPVNLDVREFGELLLDDLFRIGSGAKSERNLFLFANGLLVVKRKEDGTFVFKNYIEHSNLMLSEVIPDNPLQFSVIAFDNPKVLTVIEAKSMDQKRAWTSRLKEMMLKKFGVTIPEHVQQLVMQLGEVHQSTNTENSPRRFRPAFFHAPAAPDYLHRRRIKSPIKETVATKSATDRSLRSIRRQTAPPLDLEGMGNYSGQSADCQMKGPTAKNSNLHRANGKDKTKTTALFHVSTDYLPRMKEDEFMYEEIHVTSDSHFGDASRRKSASALQDSFLTISPRRKERQKSTGNGESLSQEGSTNQLSDMFKSGIRSAFGMAKHALKSFNTEESCSCLDTTSTPGSDITPATDTTKSDDDSLLELDSFTEAVNALALRPSPMALLDDTSHGYYEKNFDLLDSLSGGGLDNGHDNGSTMDSDKEDWHSASFSAADSPSPSSPIATGVVCEEQPAADRRTGVSIKRKGAIKKRSSTPRTKSAPATPEVMNKTGTSSVMYREPSSLIQQKIRSLEERSFWKSSGSVHTDLQTTDFTPTRSAGHTLARVTPRTDTTTSNLSLNEPKQKREDNYVTMIVNRIESTSDLKLS